MKGSKDLNLLLVVVLVMLTAAVPDKIQLPDKFYQLVQDKTNVMLLMTLCLLISYCNFPLGVMMSLFVFIVMINSQYRLEGFEGEREDNGLDPDSGSRNNDLDYRNNDTGFRNDDPGSINNDTGSRNNDTGSRNDDPGFRNDDTGSRNDDPGSRNNDLGSRNDDDGSINISNNASSSEFKQSIGNKEEAVRVLDSIKNRLDSNDPATEVCDKIDQLNNYIKCRPGNQGESNDISDEGFNSAYSNEPPMDNESGDMKEGFIGKQLREQFQSQKQGGHDYDVVGCRYDLQGNLDNEFVQGPPLAGCQTYDSGASSQIGTDFYPINP